MNLLGYKAFHYFFLRVLIAAHHYYHNTLSVIQSKLIKFVPV